MSSQETQWLIKNTPAEFDNAFDTLPQDVQKTMSSTLKKYKCNGYILLENVGSLHPTDIGRVFRLNKASMQQPYGVYSSLVKVFESGIVILTTLTLNKKPVGKFVIYSAFENSSTKELIEDQEQKIRADAINFVSQFESCDEISKHIKSLKTSTKFEISHYHLSIISKGFEKACDNMAKGVGLYYPVVNCRLVYKSQTEVAIALECGAADDDIFYCLYAIINENGTIIK